MYGDFSLRRATLLGGVGGRSIAFEKIETRADTAALETIVHLQN
jgi:hypothetical protein